ncbi:hypothetical protein IE077_001105, partial [Cardiosporidium cionae]
MYGLCSPPANLFSKLQDITSVAVSSLRSLQIESTAIPEEENPFFCFTQGSSMLWLLEDKKTIPLYVKDSLVQTTNLLDYGSFRKLKQEISLGNEISTAFIFTFLVNGIFTFTTDSNGTSSPVTIIKVVQQVKQCPQQILGIQSKTTLTINSLIRESTFTILPPYSPLPSIIFISAITLLAILLILLQGYLRYKLWEFEPTKLVLYESYFSIFGIKLWKRKHIISVYNKRSIPFMFMAIFDEIKRGKDALQTIFSKDLSVKPSSADIPIFEPVEQLGNYLDEKNSIITMASMFFQTSMPLVKSCLRYENKAQQALQSLDAKKDLLLPDLELEMNANVFKWQHDVFVDICTDVEVKNFLWSIEKIFNARNTENLQSFNISSYINSYWELFNKRAANVLHMDSLQNNLLYSIEEFPEQIQNEIAALPQQISGLAFESFQGVLNAFISQVEISYSKIFEFQICVHETLMNFQTKCLQIHKESKNAPEKTTLTEAWKNICINSKSWRKNCKSVIQTNFNDIQQAIIHNSKDVKRKLREEKEKIIKKIDALIQSFSDDLLRKVQIMQQEKFSQLDQLFILLKTQCCERIFYRFGIELNLKISSLVEEAKQRSDDFDDSEELNTEIQKVVDDYKHQRSEAVNKAVLVYQKNFKALQNHREIRNKLQNEIILWKISKCRYEILCKIEYLAEAADIALEFHSNTFQELMQKIFCVGGIYMKHFNQEEELPNKNLGYNDKATKFTSHTFILTKELTNLITSIWEKNLADIPIILSNQQKNFTEQLNHLAPHQLECFVSHIEKKKLDFEMLYYSVK